MIKYIVLDTETTSLEADRKIIDIAYQHSNINDDGKSKLRSTYIKTESKIEIKAKVVHGITEKRLEEEGIDWRDFLVFMEEDFLREEVVLIGHNIKFDIEALANMGVDTSKFRYIDTYKLAYRLYTDEAIESYSLQYLRYYFDLFTDSEFLNKYKAHGAEADILVNDALFCKIVEEYMEKHGFDLKKTLENFELVSTKPLLLRICYFPKHKGEQWEDVARDDKGYLNYLRKSIQDKKGTEEEDKNEDLEFTLKYYLFMKK